MLLFPFIPLWISRGFTSSTNGLCKMGHVQEASNLFNKLQSEGIRPDAITYNTLISRHCHEGMFNDACLLLYKGVDSGFIPNEVTWSILINYIVKKIPWGARFSKDFTVECGVSFP